MDKINLPVISEKEVAEHIYRDYRGVTVEIAPEVTTKTLMDTMQWGLDHLVTDTPIISAPLTKIISDFCLLEAFTNLNMRDIDALSAADGVYRVYDLFADLASDVGALVNQTQKDFLLNGLKELAREVMTFRNSAAGILESLTSQAKNSTDTFQQSLSVLKDAEGLENIKGLLDAIHTLETPLT